MCAKVRARAPLNAKKRTFGGPRVEQMGAQNVPKIEVSKKVPKVVWTYY